VDSTRPRSQTKKKKRNSWPVKVFFLTFMLAMVFSFFSETTLMGVSVPVAVLFLFLIILIGILFDAVGIAVTFQDITAYTAMASKKIPGAKYAIKLVQNASMVSNICNDVVGDICGIVSGAMGAAIAAKLLSVVSDQYEFLLGIVISSLVAGFTVGGKAVGKIFAVQYSHEIVFFIGKFFSVFSKKERKKGK